MGTGKTSWALQFINDKENEYKRFFYVTPYLSEVLRVQETCPDRNFTEPKVKQGVLEDTGEVFNKSVSLLDLVRKGRNICTTHSLLSNISDELIEALRSQNYILILDEVFDVVRELKSTYFSNDSNKMREDIRKVIEMFAYHGAVTVSDKDYSIEWNQEKADESKVEQDRYFDVIRMAKRGLLYLVDDTIVYWSFPCELFRDIFEESYILTFRFRGEIQNSYYNYYNLGYEFYHPVKIGNKYKLIQTLNDEFEKNWIISIRDRIQIVEDSKLNKIGDKFIAENGATYETNLSASWYYRDSISGYHLTKILLRNANNFFNNIAKTKSAKKRMWTTFKFHSKQFYSALLGKTSFVSIGTRAVNTYSGRTMLAYLVNRYHEPYIKKFFSKKNIVLSDNEWALNDLLQWIWRGNLRVTEKQVMITKKKKRVGNVIKEVEEKETVFPEVVQVYIPSERMRNLLINYLWFDKITS